MSFELLVYQDRTNDFALSLTQRGQPYALATGDKLRFKWGRGLDLLALDLVSPTVTTNGSFIQITSQGSPGPPVVGAAYNLRLAQLDVFTNDPGTYDCEVSIVLAAGGLCEIGDVGVLDLIGMMAGVLT
jgi:hypothetical protein